MKDVFKPAGQPNTTTWASLLKLNQPLWRTNHGHKNISYIAQIIWNNLSNSLKTKDNLNTYKHSWAAFLSPNKKRSKQCL